mgnify:CR=1 FL=1|jgi:hypothetical protein
MDKCWDYFSKGNFRTYEKLESDLIEYNGWKNVDFLIFILKYF